MDTPTILSIVALFSGGVAVAMIKIFASRSFKSTDEKIATLADTINQTIKLLDRRVEQISLQCADRGGVLHKMDNEIIRTQEFKKNIENQLKMIRAENSREIQLITSHLETVHNKISNLDDKLEKLRDRKIP